MMVIIIGANRAELYKVKANEQDKHFIQSKGQLYKVYPDGLRRMRIYGADGKEKDSEEVLVYPENGIVPYKPTTTPYDADRILAEIDGHKEARGMGGLLGPTAYIKAGVDMWKQIRPILPMLIAVVVVAYAFVSGRSR